MDGDGKTMAANSVGTMKKRQAFWIYSFFINVFVAICHNIGIPINLMDKDD